MSIGSNRNSKSNDKKKKVVKDWAHDILKIDQELSNILVPNKKNKDKMDCVVCCESGNTTYCSFLKSHIIGHFESDRHVTAMKNKQLNNLLLLKKLNALKYGIEMNDGDNREMVSEGQDTKIQDVLTPAEKEGSIKLKFAIAKFIVDHQLPYTISSDIINLIQVVTSTYPEKSINTCTLDRNQTSRIIKEHICPTLRSEIIKHLDQSPFSISIDESTDIQGTSYLAVTANYLPHIINDDRISFKEPVTSLVSVIKLDDSHTGEAIYTKLMEEFFSLSPNLENNCIGIACDEGSSMSGKRKGVAGRLCLDFPYMIKVNDWSHKLNLICKASLKTFPCEVINIVNNISTRFSHSSLRRAKLTKIQKSMNKESSILGVLTYTPVRWLSYCECLARIIELWEPLKAYFMKYGDKDDRTAMSIENELYLRLILILLSKLTYYNKKFQTGYLYYKDILKLLKQSFIVFAQFLLATENRNLTFDEIFALPWTAENSEELLPHLCSFTSFMEELIKDYSSIQELVSKVDESTKKGIFEHCQSFILKVLSVMKSKYTIDEKVIKATKCVFLLDGNFDKEDWMTLASQFTNIISSQEQHLLLADVDRFRIDYSENQAEARTKNPAALWSSLQDEFPYMARLAKAVLVLPQSSVSVERVFAQLKNFKTEKRNRLNAENVQASLLLHQKFGEGKFEITQEMLSSYNNPLKRSYKRASSNKPIDTNNQNPPKEEVKCASSDNENAQTQNSNTTLISQTPNVGLAESNLAQTLQALMRNALTDILLGTMNNKVGNKGNNKLVF